MPTTSYPSDFNSAAVTEESTPPDMATTTLVSCGRPSRSRLLSMVQVTDATAGAIERLARDQEALGATRSPLSGSALNRFQNSDVRRSETVKPFFNIGRIPVRQSEHPVLRPARGKSCRRAEKGPVPAPPYFSGFTPKILKNNDITVHLGWPAPC